MEREGREEEGDTGVRESGKRTGCEGEKGVREGGERERREGE